LDGLDERDSPCAEVNHAIYLSDAEWALLESLPPKSHKSERVNDRKIVNAMLYELRTGTPRRDLPARYGSALPAVASISSDATGKQINSNTIRSHSWLDCGAPVPERPKYAMAVGGRGPNRSLFDL
jgi:hypothetical protein